MRCSLGFCMRVFELIFWSLVAGALLFGLFGPLGGY